MTYTIENDRLQITVNDTGAELFSVRSLENGCEYLWQGDPKYWVGRAPNMFPICGRLCEGRYTYRGREYEMLLHGFTRKRSFTLIKEEKNRLVFSFKADGESLAVYPFNFEFITEYTIEGNSVKVGFEVRNLDEKELIFALGAHPGFNVPPEEGTAFGDWYLEFEGELNPRAIVFGENHLCTGETADFTLENGNILPLRHSLFDKEGIFLYGAGKAVTLKSDKSPRSVRVDYPDMKILGLWQTPGTDTPFLCIEPWTGIPAREGIIDDLETKSEMLRLLPGAVYGNAIAITVL